MVPTHFTNNKLHCWITNIAATYAGYDVAWHSSSRDQPFSPSEEPAHHVVNDD